MTAAAQRRVALLALAMSAGCAAAPLAADPPRPAKEAPPPAPLRPWRFDVVAGEGARELSVEAVVFARGGEAVGVEGAGSFLSGVEVSAGGPYRPLAAERDAAGDPAFRLPSCPPEGCRVRYHFALAEAARRVADISCAEDEQGAFLTSPSAWLLHLADPPDDLAFELHVTTPPGLTFVSGILPSGDGAPALPPAVYGAGLADLPNPAWAAFGPLHLLRVDIEDEAIDVAVLPGGMEAGDAGLAAWVSGAARAVRAYYGRASIRRALLAVVPREGRGVRFARTLGNGGATIVAYVGERTTPADFAAGWELVHELLHVSFPNLPREEAWLEEGMATYVEPLVRARRGILPAADVFAHFRARMPLGQPAPGDQGLDHTHTWGRTYWGGAMFCLLADVAIRERTQNRRSLDDALRAVLAAGGNVSRRWDVADVIAAGDAATGVPVLRELYDRMGAAPVEVDLATMWRRLGVGEKDGRVVLDDGAELAVVRRAMTGG